MNNTTKILIGIGTAAVLFFAIRKFLFKPDLEILKYWTPLYYKNFPAKEKIEVLTPSFAKAAAAVIKESKGNITDAEGVLVASLKKNIKTKTQLSFLSDVFQGLYKESMAKYINSFANKDTLKELADWSKKLPSKKI